jgi:hypothetical protein
MRRNGCVFVVLLGICASAEAQTTPDRPKVEVAASIGVISASPGENNSQYDDDWYGQGRYAASIAYYWTRHLKTEFEHQWSGEGQRYFQDFTRVNGVPVYYSVQSYHQLQQSSLRVVWQFRDNAWVHPYVSAGAVLDIERQHSHTPPIYQTSGRDPLLLGNAVHSGHRTELRGGWTIGGGAKFYMTEQAFFNTGLVGTFSKPAGTVSVVAGFGIDF